MERRFSVKSKTFNLSAKESVVCLEERRKGFVGVILLGHHCAAWLVGGHGGGGGLVSGEG